MNRDAEESSLAKGWVEQLLCLVQRANGRRYVDPSQNGYRVYKIAPLRALSGWRIIRTNRCFTILKVIAEAGESSR